MPEQVNLAAIRGKVREAIDASPSAQAVSLPCEEALILLGDLPQGEVLESVKQAAPGARVALPRVVAQAATTADAPAPDPEQTRES